MRKSVFILGIAVTSLLFAGALPASEDTESTAALGTQGHISAPGGGMFSPFFGATALTAIPTADDVEPGILLWPSYGFEIIYRSFSLSGIVQPFMGPAGNYTASIGFEW